MVIYLIAVGTNMPSWVKEGFFEYASRLKQEVRLELIEITAIPRKKKADTSKILKEEGIKILEAIPKNTLVIGLDIIGKAYTTLELSKQMESWLTIGSDIVLLVGGPEGFDENVKKRFDRSISLSRLTLPHPMVRILIAEQLFRAWSILHNHPYHRE